MVARATTCTPACRPGGGPAPWRAPPRGARLPPWRRACPLAGAVAVRRMSPSMSSPAPLGT
eukprot:2279636-Alexandrium_andersonii.AAC.1